MTERSSGGRARRARLAPGASLVVASVLIAALVATLRPALAKARSTTHTHVETAPPIDPARLTAFLAALRGTSPVACELAVRSVADRGWNGRNGDAPSADTASRRLVRDVLDASLDRGAVPLLRAALGDPDACVRRIAAPMLGRIDDASAIAALVVALRDDAPATRHAAATGLAYARKPYASTTHDPLVAALRDGDASVRAASAWALGALEDAAAIEPLATRLRTDADAVVRQYAAWALGQIK